MEFGSEKFWNFLEIFSTRCNWNLARTIFGISLENSRGYAIGIWLRQDLELFQNIFNEMQLEFGYDKIWNCLRIFSMRCNWNLAKTRFGIVLEHFRWHAIGIWLRQDLELFQIIFNEMQMQFV